MKILPAVLAFLTGCTGSSPTEPDRPECREKYKADPHDCEKVEELAVLSCAICGRRAAHRIHIARFKHPDYHPYVVELEPK